MISIEKLKDTFKGFNKAPVLFIGAGLSRRYLELGNWETLLREMSKLIKDNELAYEMYSRKAKNEGFKVGEFQKIAELIENDISDAWFEDTKFEASREEYKELAIEGVSPLKIEIAKYIKENSLRTQEEYKHEIELFRKLGKKSIAAVITTNYDTFIEDNLKNYIKYVGQEELIFSNIQGVGEIYKIHGCCTAPDSIVINEKDYIEFEEKNAYLAAKILTIFLEHPIIFLGYSLADKNIQSILKAIVKCLSKEKLETFKKRLIFVEWNNTEEKDEISGHSIFFDGEKSLEMTKVYLKDYSNLYDELLNNKFKYNTTVLRRLKEEIYELVVSNEPSTKMRVVGIEDDENLDNIEFVVGVGVMSDFGKTGYSGLKVEEIFQDILFDKGEYDANLIVMKSIPILLKHNAGSVPIYKYISKATVSIPLDVKNAIKSNYDDLLSRTIRNHKKRCDFKDKTIKDVVGNNSMSKSLSIIPLIPEANIVLKDLEEFLRSVYTDNPDIFLNGQPSDKTNFRRLIKIYDWLEYHKKKNPTT
ncbi:SIR2 family protein [Clostridium sp. CS001]|uniref:SIR2 family protein n=1 Tax=Clostridium sp. CS001 TaxID=2880648 RepID=UPI001CF23DB3|nr:SIR2 family protein [Clostridium sp. CS001]MCB2291017.1 SIR2 family protein [Clostridium sp. CS001]